MDQTAQQANSDKSGQQQVRNNNNQHHNNHHQHHSQNLNLNDSEINSSRNHNENAEQQHTNNNNQNSPYCLKCFDRVFGETCEECGKLITCDLGAINHEQRCWHASGVCFKCRACLKSLLGSPFLPSSDGQIYCSIQCCELFKQTGQQQHQKKTIHNQQRLSLANYCDPRAPQGALQHQLSLAADNNNKGQLSAATQSQMEVAANKLQSSKQRLNTDSHKTANAAAAAAAATATAAGLLRHKPLIDYLLANARSDEFSHQLLNCLYGQFKLTNKQAGDTPREHLAKDETCGQTNLEETKLLSQIGNTLEQIESEQKSNQFLRVTGKESSDSGNSVAINSIITTTGNNNDLQDQQLSARRNKLNPFLIDSYAGINNKRVVVGNGATNNNNNNNINSTKQMVMSMVMDGSGEVGESTKALANYINLDLSLANLPFQQLDQQQKENEKQHKLKQEPVDSVDNGSHNIQRLKQPQETQLKKSNGNNNKIFGVQSGNVFANLNSKASQCSPAVSLVSNEGTISDHSATSSGVSTAPPVSSTNGSLKSHSPLSSTSSHSSVSGASISSSTGISSEQHQAHLLSSKQPLRQHINSVSATLERRRRVQPITELSVLDLLSVADDQLSSQQFQQQQQQQQSISDGFEQLVSHFKGRTNSLQRQQFPLKQATCFSGDPNNKHQESFFFELAQRLPKNGGGCARDSSIQINPSLHPLDTNGLPTVESSDSLASVSKPTTTAARTITDHYSTVNKASKLNAEQAKLPLGQQQQQMVSGDNVRDSFFAITSPLLSCKMDQIEEVDLCKKSGGRSTTNIRPTSSLSVLAPVADFTASAAAAAEQPNNLLHPSLSTGSLNCPDSSLIVRETNQQHGNNSPLILFQPTTSSACLQQQQQQKPTTKAPKSVSFDPTVKDSERSPTGSMTLGRASALKSALKSSSSFQRQHQDFMNFSQSSNTLPASFANQFKSGSLNAYSAYYDEYGRRIKLSSLLQNPTGFNEMQPIVNDEERECGEEEEEEDRKSKSSGGKSILSGALSRLSLTGSQASRGGRREERKLRLQQQQQQQQLTVQTSQPIGNLSNQELFGQPLHETPQGILMQQNQCIMPSTSTGGFGQQQQQQLVEQSNLPQRVRRRHSRPRSRRSSSSSSSHRRRGSSSSSSNHRRRGGGSSSSDKRHRGRSSRQSRRQRSKRLHQKRRSSRHCNDDDCYDSDDSSTCSTCSTCSSSTSYTNCSSSDSGDESICSSSDRSDCSHDDSYTSDTDSSHSSTSCSSYSSRSSSPIRDRECRRRKSSSSSRRRKSRRTEKSGRHKYSRHCC